MKRVEEIRLENFSDIEKMFDEVKSVAKAKNTEGSAATGGQGQCDYDSLPFWSENKAESNAGLSVRDKLEKIRQSERY